MKILFVSAVLPYPLHSGGQIRIYNLLKRLSNTQEIHLFSFIRSESEKKELSHLSFCKTVTTVLRGRVWQPKYLFGSLTSTYPLLWSSYHNSEMLSLLADELTQGRYDVVHLEPGYVWPAVPETRIPVVVCEHNIEHTVYEAYVRQFPLFPLRPFLSLDVAKMIRWESQVWREAAGIVSVSDADRDYIAHSVAPDKISIVPNGVDIRAFPFRPKKSWDAKSLTFLYVGNFFWMENRDAVERLVKDYWSVIIGKYPRAELRIVGKLAPKHLKRFASDSVHFLEDVDVVQTEFVGADILLAPIHIGGGTKYKILEAMASGLPVITTKLGVGGIRGSDGKQFLLAENVGGVLPLIERLSDQSERMALVKNARTLVETQYSWDMIAHALDAAWKDAYEKRH